MFFHYFEMVKLNFVTVDTPWKQSVWPPPGQIHSWPPGKNPSDAHGYKELFVKLTVLLFNVQVVKNGGPFFLTHIKNFVNY